MEYFLKQYLHLRIRPSPFEASLTSLQVKYRQWTSSSGPPATHRSQAQLRVTEPAKEHIKLGDEQKELEQVHVDEWRSEKCQEKINENYSTKECKSNLPGIRNSETIQETKR